MSTLSVPRQARSLFPEFSELFAAFPSFASARPALDTRVMRLEDEVKDGRYEVRAEIPGVDPAKDIDVTVRDGQLTIKAERSEKKEFNGRSEFSYGSFRSHGLTAGGRRRRQHRGDLRQGHPYCLGGDFGAKAHRAACSGPVVKLT